MVLPASSLLSLSLFVFLVRHGSTMAQTRYERQRGQCLFERLSALHPTGRTESEAGVTEFFSEENEQLQCAGVSAYLRTIQPRGLLLPHFSNAPRLAYVLQGRGVAGYLIPGCPESFQFFEQGEEKTTRKGESESWRFGQQSFRDQHQKLRRFRQGDILAIPAGIAFWAFNDGEYPLVTFTVADTSSSANQLDSYHRQFQLAGSKKGPGGSQASSESNNFFRAFSTELLSQALGVPRELAQKIQKEDSRGEIVKVRGDLDLVRPYSSPRSEEMEEEISEGRRPGRSSNGLEQVFCSARFIENIENPRHSDFFNPLAGWITHISSQKLPSLRFIRLSAFRGVLRRRATMVPHWILNAHSVVYVTRGSARVQVVDDSGRAVFDGEFRKGQLLVLPQNFAVVMQAGDDGYEYVAIETNGSPFVSPIAGKGSVLKGLPEDVLATAFGLRREEARLLKFARGEQVAIFPESSQQQQSRPCA